MPRLIKFLIIGKPNCEYTQGAINFLKKYPQVSFQSKMVNKLPTFIPSNHTTFPAILGQDQKKHWYLVGGFNELKLLEKHGLKKLRRII